MACLFVVLRPRPMLYNRAVHSQQGFFISSLHAGKVMLIHDSLSLNSYQLGAREMAQWLRASTALEGSPCLVPSTHMVAHSLL